MRLNERLTSPAAAVAWRLVGEIFLGILWIQGPDQPAGLALVLFLCILSLARWRFALPAWTVLVDQAACAAAMQLWPQASFGLALPVFDAVAAAQPWFALPVILVAALRGAWSLPLVFSFCAAAGAGTTVLAWRRETERLRREADVERREKFDLTRLKDDLLVANVQTARAAELAERARIARDLHDHLGHELTAAGLALQAFDQLRGEDEGEAAAFLSQAERRITEGLAVLRSTVSGMAPSRETGVGALAEICRTLSDSPPELLVHGDATLVPQHAWSVLEPCLKEGLTNAARHGAPGRISVTLDIGPRIVRLCVHNEAEREASGADGRASDADRGGGGLGLRSLRQRARAVGGSLTTDATSGFRLICVLPLSAAGGEAIPRGSAGDML